MTRAIVERGLVPYLQKIREYPMLSVEDERTLVRRWRESKDPKAAERLVTSHLRLVAKIAGGYRGYKLPLSDLISEGSVGIMKALQNFDPDRGSRFATYATWWIRAAIQEYVLHSWSIVKIGTTAAQRKLFFNLGRLKREHGVHDERHLSPEEAQAIAKELETSEDEVVAMNSRLAWAHESLNTVPRNDDGGGSSVEWLDRLADTEPDQETVVTESLELQHRRRLLQGALGCLNSRERDVLCARRLSDSRMSLSELSLRHGVSLEAVRQTEIRAIDKLRNAFGKADQPTVI